MKKIIILTFIICIFVIAGCAVEPSAQELESLEEISSETTEDNQSEDYNQEDVVSQDTEGLFADFLEGKVSASIHPDMDTSDISYNLSAPLEGTLEAMKNQYISDCGNENLKLQYTYLSGSEENSILAISFYNEGVTNEWDVAVYVLLANIENTLQVVYEGTSYSRGSLTFYDNSIIVSAGSSGATVHVSNEFLITPDDTVDCISEFVSIGLDNYHYLFSEYSEYYETTYINQNTVNGQMYVYVYMYENENENLRNLIEQSEICADCIVCETEDEFNNVSKEYAQDNYGVDISVEAEVVQWKGL